MLNAKKHEKASQRYVIVTRKQKRKKEKLRDVEHMWLIMIIGLRALGDHLFLFNL